jgi:hypothetical protein
MRSVAAFPDAHLALPGLEFLTQLVPRVFSDDLLLEMELFLADLRLGISPDMQDQLEYVDRMGEALALHEVRAKLTSAHFKLRTCTTHTHTCNRSHACLTVSRCMEARNPCSLSIAACEVMGVFPGIGQATLTSRWNPWRTAWIWAVVSTTRRRQPPEPM